MMSQQRAVKKIGVIIDCLHESYQSTIWNGLAKAAAARGVTLISYVATSQDRTSHFSAHYQMISDFVVNSDVDGLILFSGSINEHHGPAFVRGFAKVFSDIPTVCISSEVAGFPSVVVDNSRGIHELIHHMVEVHNLHHIAFVKGPAGHQEADERYIAYREGLDNNNLGYDAALVVEGDFSRESGEQAVATLIERKVHFDAIIAADDKAAFGVIAELKKRKIHIPTEVAVAGFDDVSEASLSLPSLTTVRQPLSQMGETALLNLLDQLDHQRLQRKTRLPAQPVFRRSCGCFGENIRNARAVMVSDERMTRQQIVEVVYQRVARYFDQDSALYPGEDRLRGYFNNLLESLVWDVEKASIREIFLNEVDMLLFKFEEFADSINMMNVALTEIAAYIPTLFNETSKLASAAAIVQQGQALVREHRLNSAQTHYLQDTFFQLMIRETSQSIITTFEQRKLLQAISVSFPELNIRSLVFATYKKDDVDVPLTSDNWDFPHQSHLLLSYDRSRDIVNYPRGDSTFMSKDLFPPGMYDDKVARNYVFMPLFFEDEHLGFAVFEYTDGVPLFMYEELRLHMSSALKSSFLMKELRIQSMLDELTGLHNRRGFHIEAKKMFRRRKKSQQRIMVFYADLDDLKAINDNYGHEEGDIAISGAASVLRQTFREGDVVARIGGDEFVAMLVWQEESVEALEQKITERLKISLDAYNQVMEKPYELSISIGIATTEMEDDKTLDALMREADDRLLERKRFKHSGRESREPTPAAS